MDGTLMRHRFFPSFKYLLKLFGLLLLALLVSAFHVWLVLNWWLRCCDGGVCVPDWYSACNPEPQEIKQWSPFMIVSTLMPPTS